MGMTNDVIVLRVPRECGPLVALALRTGDRALRRLAHPSLGLGAPSALLPVDVRDGLLAVLDPGAAADERATLRRTYTTSRAAQVLGVSDRYVRRLAASGRLRADKAADQARSVLVDADQVDVIASRRAVQR